MVLVLVAEGFQGSAQLHLGLNGGFQRRVFLADDVQDLGDAQRLDLLAVDGLAETGGNHLGNVTLGREIQVQLLQRLTSSLLNQ